MKRLRSFVIAIEVLGLITACQTTSTGANTSSVQMEDGNYAQTAGTRKRIA